MSIALPICLGDTLSVRFQVLVHYDGYATDDDEWVHYKDLRPEATKAPRRSRDTPITRKPKPAKGSPWDALLARLSSTDSEDDAGPQRWKAASPLKGTYVHSQSHHTRQCIHYKSHLTRSSQQKIARQEDTDTKG